MADNEIFTRIDTITGSFFTYTVGYFKQPGVHAIGTMDLKDQGARDGGESEIIFYFIITPEEFSWYKEAPDKLEDLAQRLQIHMPKNRFISAICSNKDRDPKEVREIAQEALGDDSLDNDTAFAAYTEELKERAKQAAAAAQLAKQMAALIAQSPLGQPRHALALHQKKIRNMDAAIQKAMKELPEEEEARKEAEEKLAKLRDERKEEAKNGAPLETALGKQIYTSATLWVAMDSNWNPRYPFIDPRSMNACLFSTKESADKFVKKLTDENRYYLTVREMPHEEFRNFFRALEMLGVITVLLDDSTEPVRLLLRNIMPRLEHGFIEAHNSMIRCMILRDLQISFSLHKHRDAMEEEWRMTQQDMQATIDRSMLQELGKTALFIPVRFPDKLTKQLAENYAYTDAGMEKIQAVAKEHNQKNIILNRMGFAGQHVNIRMNPGTNPPFSVLNLPDPQNPQAVKQWVPVFTSREEATDFASRQKGLEKTTILAVSMDELQNYARNMEGILVDPHSFGLRLPNDKIAQCIALRSERKLVYDHHHKPEA